MINLESEFSPRVNPADANYPFGSIKDNSSPGANDGTPLAAVWGNDWEGFAQAAMTEAGITPSGLPDTAQDSQLLDAVKAVTSDSLRGELAAPGGAGLVGMPAILTPIPSMTLEHSFEWANEVGLPAKFFGIKGDGSALDAQRIQDAADAQTVVKFPRGVFVTTGLLAREGTAFIGLDWGTIIKLADGSNKNVIGMNNTPYTVFSRLKIDGNKSAQTLGGAFRGLYYIGANSVWGRIDHVWIDNVLDHGAMHSVSGAGAYNIYTGCRASNCGSSAHAAAGGPGGTGFAAGGEGVKHLWGLAEDCYLNGWKSAGAYHERLTSKSCGSGFETGFGTPTDDLRFTEYHSVKAIDCSVGMNHQGASTDILVSNFYTNATSGAAIRLLGSLERFRMYDSDINNYGQGLATDQTDAIFIGVASGTYKDFDIDRNKFTLSDSISKSDRWAVRMVQGVEDFNFGAANRVLGGGPGVYKNTTPLQRTTVGNYIGNSGRYKLESAVTLTTSGEFVRRNILGRERVKQGYSVDLSVDMAGSGAKTIRLGVGLVGIQLALNTTQQGVLNCSVKIAILDGVPGVRVLGHTTDPSGVRTEINQLVSIANLTDMPVYVNATLTPTDSASLRSFSMNLTQ